MGIVLHDALASLEYVVEFALIKPVQTNDDVAKGALVVELERTLGITVNQRHPVLVIIKTEYVTVKDRMCQRRPDHRVKGGMRHTEFEIGARNPVNTLGQCACQIPVALNCILQVPRLSDRIDRLQ